MALVSDPVNLLLVGLLIAVLVAFAMDEFGPTLGPTLKRYQTRYVPSGVTWRTFILLILAVTLASLMRTPLISAYLVAAGALITFYQLRRLKREQRRLKPGQILQFLVSFRGEYFLQPSVFSTLDKVKDKCEEPLKSMVRVTVETYFLTSSPERSFAELRSRTDNVYINQFAYILEMSESATPDAVVKALDSLVDRLRTHEELRMETQANLSSITTQTLIMQVVAVAILMIVAVVPMLRSAYASLGGQLFYVGVMTAMLLSSYYIDHEISRLAERIS